MDSDVILHRIDVYVIELQSFR